MSCAGVLCRAVRRMLRLFWQAAVLHTQPVKHSCSRVLGSAEFCAVVVSRKKGHVA
jgi:hypothetical protein